MDTVYSGAMAFVATATDDIRVSELRQNLGKTAPTGIKANGNGMRYLQKRRKEEEGTEGIYPWTTERVVKDAITSLTADENCSLMESSFRRNLTKKGPQLARSH